MSKTESKALLSALQARYPHVSSIAKIGKHGKPTRVVIGCVADGCKAKREIATQDAFQVERCQACQREAAKARRRKTPVEAPKPKAVKAPKRQTRRRRMATRQTRLKSQAASG